MPIVPMIVLWAVMGAALAPVVEAAIIALPARLSLVRVLASGLAERRTRWGFIPILGALLRLVEHGDNHVGSAATSGRDWSRASARRFLVESALTAAFAWLAWRHGLSWPTFVLSVYVVIFVIIVGTDLEHHLILNRVVAPAAVFALLASPIMPNMGLARALLGAAAGFLLMLLPALAMPGGLGGGDVKLAGLLGLMTGFAGVLTALTIGILLGGLATALLLVTRRIGRRDYVPYGPFLIGGAFFVLIATYS